MNTDGLNSIVSRLCFAGAVVLSGVAVLERLMNILGYTFLQGYTPGRLLDFATVLLLFTFTILLRQVRDRVGQKA